MEPAPATPRPNVAVDAGAFAVRLELRCTTDENGLLGFSMEQPSNRVISLRQGAPCYSEGLLRVGDQLVALDGAELETMISPPERVLAKLMDF